MGRRPVRRPSDLTAELIPTAGHPLVYAESPPVAGRPTVLVYGHYDVQPPDPLELWTTPALRADAARAATSTPAAPPTTRARCSPTSRAPRRGSTARRRLPVQLKFIIEGEEEVGSHGLEKFLADARRAAGLRLRRHQRRRQVQPRHPGHHLRAAGHRLLRAARDRPEPRPALRHVRRLGDQSGQRPGADPGGHDRRARQGPDSGLLRRRGAAVRARAGANWPRCRSTRPRIFAEIGVIGGASARRATRRWNAAGPGRRSTSAACASGYQGEGPRPCCPPRPRPSSASAWCPTRTRRRSPRPCGEWLPR